MAVQEICGRHIQAMVWQRMERQSGRRLHHLCQPQRRKLSTIQYFITLAMQQGMVWVGQPAMNDGSINRLGSNSGVMAQVGPTSPAADIPQGDLDTAKAYGERVAAVAAKLRG